MTLSVPQVPKSHQEGPRGAAHAPEPRIRILANRERVTAGPSAAHQGVRHDQDGRATVWILAYLWCFVLLSEDVMYCTWIPDHLDINSHKLEAMLALIDLVAWEYSPLGRRDVVSQHCSLARNSLMHSAQVQDQRIDHELERQADVATKRLGRREESELMVHCGAQQRRGRGRTTEKLDSREEGREGAMQRSRRRPARLDRCGLWRAVWWRHRGGAVLRIWNAHAVRRTCKCAREYVRKRASSST